MFGGGLLEPAQHPQCLARRLRYVDLCPALRHLAAEDLHVRTVMLDDRAQGLAQRPMCRAYGESAGQDPLLIGQRGGNEPVVGRFRLIGGGGLGVVTEYVVDGATSADQRRRRQTSDREEGAAVERTRNPCFHRTDGTRPSCYSKSGSTLLVERV